jgi:hypothetical protein
VAVTDFFQFIIAMTGCIVLACFTLNLPQIGGIDGLKKALPTHVFDVLPRLSFGPETAAYGIMAMSASAFIAHMAIQW